jgi:hypothetical protein
MSDDRSNLKLQSGDVLSANIWNRVIERLPDRNAGVGTDVHLINKTVVQCKAHTDIGIAEVWAVDAYLGDTTDVYEIAPSHILSVTDVVWPENCHKLVVAERPVLQDEIGPFAYNGGAIVELTAGVGDHAFPDPADTTKMKQGSSGYRILNFVGSSRAVVDLAEPQNLWLYELTEAYTGGASGNGHILTLYDEQFSNSPTTINFEGDCKPDALQSGHKGYCIFADGAFWAIDQCGGGGGSQTKRIRFVLENKFNDTGQALANVLDTFGTTGLVRGDQVVVNDPRKLFAHAIGFQNINITPDPANNVFECGGSIGYAVWTEAPDIDPPSTADYPRYEVEQCTQTVSKMKVFVYESGSSGSETAKSRPTGETGETACTLYFGDQSNFSSRWPDVDFCESWGDVTDPEIPAVYKYKVQALNPHRFSAKRGSWCIIEKSTTPQRPENACNDVTPYAGFGDPAPEWTITDVELPIARWIRVEFVSKGEGQAPDVWRYGGDYAEGEDPTINYFRDDVTFDSRIQTATGMDTGCMIEGEIGWAFWDPNEQFYNVIVTNSALYGSPIDVKVIGHTDQAASLLSATDCEISYPEFASIPVFGIKPDACEVEPTTNSVDLGLNAVQVVAGVTRVHDELCFDYQTVYVCKTVPAADSCIDICCDPPLVGCCVVTYDTGSVDYLYPKTQAECADYSTQPNVVSAVWTVGPCDDPPPTECCAGVSAATEVTHAFFNFTGFMGDTTEGHFVAGSSSTSLTGECGITITFDVQWSNGTCQAQQTTSATAELKTNGTCCYWEVTLTQPNAPCVGGMGGLGDNWPGNVINIIGCSATGEFDQDCTTMTGDCATICSNGGFDSVQMTVDNIGGCQA